jgi:hypothetical protein
MIYRDPERMQIPGRRQHTLAGMCMTTLERGLNRFFLARQRLLRVFAAELLAGDNAVPVIRAAWLTTPGRV